MKVMIVDAKKLAKSPHDSKQLKELIQQRLANSTLRYKAGYYLQPLQFCCPCSIGRTQTPMHAQ